MRYFHLVLFIVVSSTIGCSNQEFAGDNAKKIIKPPCTTKAKSKDKGCPPPPPPPPPPPVQTHEAVFAVRNLACALCHATVDSSVISDFAATTTDVGSAQALANMFFVVKHGDSQTKKPEIRGKFIVPDVQTSTYASSVTAGKSNCDYSGLKKGANVSYEKTSLVDALRTCVEPFMTWGSATEKFVKKTTVAINPVSSPDEIKAIASAEAATLASAGFATIGTSTVEGITGSKLTGFKSSAAVKCEGAVVFDGPVLLKDTTISTQKGCRIYSTGSIFVFGQLNVKGPDDSAHIQLMSPVFIGFDISLYDIMGRLAHTLNAKQVFSRGSGATVAKLIGDDARLIGAAEKKWGPEVLPLGGGSSSYKRVAAAAPVVYSKSSGQFSGLIIAEQFLGKIGSLSFAFDPVFKPRESAPALFPEIKSELVSVSKD